MSAVTGHRAAVAVDPDDTTAPPDYPSLAGWREGALILIEDAARYRQPTAETLEGIVRLARLGLRGPTS